MEWFEYVGFNIVPINMNQVKDGYIYAKNTKTAEKILLKRFNYVNIIRQID